METRHNKKLDNMIILCSLARVLITNYSGILNVLLHLKKLLGKEQKLSI